MAENKHKGLIESAEALLHHLREGNLEDAQHLAYDLDCEIAWALEAEEIEGGGS